MSTILVFIAISCVVCFAYLLLKISVRSLSNQSPSTSPTPNNTGTANRDLTDVEEADLHSGPHGYSPNTACPQRQHGSMVDSDAEWNHE
jgi:hypothetical protein